MLRLTIKQRLVMLVSIFILCLAAFGVYFISYQKKNSEEVVRIEKMKEIQKLLTHIQYRLAGISNDERGYLLTGDKSFESETEQKKAEIQKDLSAIRKLSNDNDLNHLLSNVNNTLQQYYQLKDAMFSAKNLNEAKNIHFNEERTLRKQNLDPQVEKLVESMNSHVHSELTSIKKSNQMYQWILITVFIIVSVISIFIGAFFISSIIRPLTKIQKQLDEISKGKGDLTKELKIKSKDEIGLLANSFNQFLYSLRYLITNVGESANKVNQSSETLQKTSAEVLEATKEMNRHIQEVSANAENHSEMSNQSTIAVEEMVTGINHIADSASNVSELATSASQKASEGKTELDNMVKNIESLRSVVDESVNSIYRLQDQSSKIGEILKMIQSISDQTNLLALNASIEAARAGEAGRGFAVVANEVRKLAEQSLQSVNHIAEIITKVQDETERTVQLIGNVKDHIVVGSTSAKQTQSKIHEIILSFEEISSKIQEISTTTEELSSSSEEVSASVNEMNELSQNVSTIISKIAKFSQNHTQNILSVQEDADHLSDMSVQLTSLVFKFKVN
ncbi:methyl-accepting chemotaxis protein [Bacillus smithii]|uniref:methyl-accepting chemotaxis protein n=1 Tax=Bacillus smithii TaxID=1479 RepID=UPI002E1A7A6A|nr:methyl-accepting chemotaxis protein [Bacillus smithii]MED1457218.1 methyl-accepting chemotaxis protein [Bacillus smithii]MED1488855.1 methyl-accepting chemotaxis protein [Bacillus smithii]